VCVRSIEPKSHGPHAARALSHRPRRRRRPLLLPLPLRPLSRRITGAVSQSAREALLPRRLDSADNERELLRVGLATLRALVPTASGMALFTLPSAAAAEAAAVSDGGAHGHSACVEAFSPRLEVAARNAMRDSLRHIACEDPSTSVAFLCAAAADSASGWVAADSRDWPDGCSTFSDWRAAIGHDSRNSSVCFVTLAIVPTGSGRHRPPVAAALLRFENRSYSRALSWLAAFTGSSLFAAALSTPPLARDVAPVHRCCGIIGDALAARRDKAAAAALSHVNALARDIYPEHLVGAMKARHSVAPFSAAVSGGALVAQDMLCESHESVTVIFAGTMHRMHRALRMHGMHTRSSRTARAPSRASLPRAQTSSAGRSWRAA
jgi:hypothetical protein